MKVACVIVTKDRPDDLRRCLTSIQSQTVPCACVVVDGSTTAQTVVAQFGYQYYQSAPGITKQRNVARTHISNDTEVVIYCDDDTVLPPDTVVNVVAAFADGSVSGVTGQVIGEPVFGLAKKIIGTITGTYTTKPYGLSCGLFNIINPIKTKVSAQWLPGAFMCYRWSAVKTLAFDEWFSGYSLGEDFDFSYRVGQHGKLVADPKIVVEHHHSALNRNWEQFGYMRIKNRQYLRLKYWPKQPYYWLGMWWANLWLVALNSLRGLCSQRYRAELKGLLRGILTK
ncbi:MAG: glycosyltransferase family 2 protein [Candidatus Kerfeldbacteria bacterium]|nr:glycosyltransferase family 2 protein [Candidatus Kerfeldbacteria bacterium]